MDLHQMNDEERAAVIQSAVDGVLRGEVEVEKEAEHPTEEADFRPAFLNAASMASVYYHALLARGLPEALCYDLVMQWHDRMWSCGLAKGLA